MVQLFEEFKEYIVTGFISILGVIVGYLTGKRKTMAETEVVETDVIKSIRELYTSLVDDMKSTVDELKEAKKELAKLSSELTSLRKNITFLEQDLEDCRNGLSNLGNRNN